MYVSIMSTDKTMCFDTALSCKSLRLVIRNHRCAEPDIFKYLLLQSDCLLLMRNNDLN